MNLPAFLSNSVYHLAQRNSYDRFVKDMGRAREVQEKILLRIISGNQNSNFGRQFGFGRIKNISDFQKAVSIMSYEDYSPWIDHIIRGEERVLTAEPVVLLEPTGGSSGGAKLIPYTKSLKQEFQMAIGPWLADLLNRYPKIKYGRSYWSVSPVGLEKKVTPGGVPIGFEDDTDYLGFLGRLINQTLAVPSSIKNVKHIRNFRYLTAYFLLSAKDLTFISIWNPTFLTLILDEIEYSKESLVKNIFDGRISLPISEDISYLKDFIKPSPQRAKALEKLLLFNKIEDYSKVWPDLQIISCWTDASSEVYASNLKKIFAGIAIQGKGLIATEGIVSIPFGPSADHVPAYQSHFLEFQKDNEEKTQLLNELEVNKTYRVIITTSGGLYRYDLQDRVKVTGISQGLPILKFIGRDKGTDLVGEKLNEAHASTAIRESLKHFQIECHFVMLAPEINAQGGRYTLFIEPTSTDRILEASRLIDQRLKENFHYKYACELKQLLPLNVFIIKNDGQSAYMKRCLSDGQKLGTIKHSYLDRRGGWSHYFDGQYWGSPEQLETSLCP